MGNGFKSEAMMEETYPYTQAYIKRMVLGDLFSECVLEAEQVWDSIMAAKESALEASIQSFLDTTLEQSGFVYSEYDFLSVEQFQELMKERAAIKKSEMRHFLSVLHTGLIEEGIEDSVMDWSALDLFSVLDRGLKQVCAPKPIAQF